MYEVTVAQVWSETVYVSASSAKEAKKKAWENWKAKKKNYEIYAQKKEHEK